jgi:hypothetical protein
MPKCGHSGAAGELFVKGGWGERREVHQAPYLKVVTGASGIQKFQVHHPRTAACLSKRVGGSRSTDLQVTGDAGFESKKWRLPRDPSNAHVRFAGGWGGAIVLKEIEAEAVLENCRALIDQIDAGLAPEKPFVNVSSAAELLFYLEFAASALEKKPPPG